MRRVCVLAVLAVILSVYTSQASALTPELVGGITNDVLSKAMKWARVLINIIAVGQYLPDKMCADTGFLSIDFCLWGTTVNKLTISDITAQVSGTNTITLTINKFSADVTADNWKALVSGTNLNLIFADSSIVIKVIVGYDAATGTPTFHIPTPSEDSTACKANIVNLIKCELDFGFSIDVTWFMKGFISGMMSKMVPDMANPMIAKSMLSINMYANITSDIALDLRLTKAPYVSTVSSVSALSLPFVGGVVLTKDKVLPTYKSDNIQPWAKANGVQAMFGEYISNSAMITLAKAGLAVYNISEPELVDSQKMFLNTKFFRFLVRPMYQAYKNEKIAVVIEMPKTKPPTVNITTNVGMYTNTYVDISFYILKNDARVHVFTMQVDAQAYIKFKTTNNAGVRPRLMVEVEYHGFTLALTKTSVGSFDTKPLESMLDAGLSFGAVALNVLLKEGLEIPVVEGISIDTPIVQWIPGFAFVTFDLTFSSVPTDYFIDMAIANSPYYVNHPNEAPVTNDVDVASTNSNSAPRVRSVRSVARDAPVMKGVIDTVTSGIAESFKTQLHNKVGVVLDKVFKDSLFAAFTHQNNQN